MKRITAFAALLLFVACSSSRSITMTASGTHQAKAEPAAPVSFAKLTFVADQKDYFPQLQGQWLIHTMQRQVRLPEESLNLALHLFDNKTFLAASSCGDIKGIYSVKGVSIRFGEVAYDNTSCENKEQVAEMIRLLTQNVSLYAVNGNMLFLKDNSGNNVFRITR